jgi:hypothetical protein
VILGSYGPRFPKKKLVVISVGVIFATIISLLVVHTVRSVMFVLQAMIIIASGWDFASEETISDNS